MLDIPSYSRGACLCVCVIGMILLMKGKVIVMLHDHPFLSPEVLPEMGTYGE